MPMLIRLGACFFLACFVLVHCGPIENVCNPGTKGVCTCPDGTPGSRTCGDNQRMGPCYCRVTPPVVRDAGSSDASTPDPSPDVPTKPEPADEPVVDAGTPDVGDKPDSSIADVGGTNDDAQDSGSTPEPIGPDCTGANCDVCSPPCGGSGLCKAGRCVCASGLSYCANYCADLAYDPFHCGACNKACRDDQACLGRKCQCFYSTLLHTYDMGCAIVRSLHVSLDGKRLAAINDNGRNCGADLSIWDMATRKLIHQFKSVTYRPVQVLLFKDNDTVLVRGGGRRFYRFSLKQKQSIRYIDTPDKSTKCATIDPRSDNQLFAAGSGEASISIIDNVTRKNVKRITGLPGNPVDLAYSKDGKQLAVALNNKEARIYDTQSWKLLKSLKGLTDTPTSIAFNRTGTLLVLGQVNGTIAIWDPASGAIKRSIVNSGSFTYQVYRATFSNDGKYIFSSWADRTAKIHEAATGRLFHVIGGHRNEVRAFGISADGKTVITGAGTKVRLWGCR